MSGHVDRLLTAVLAVCVGMSILGTADPAAAQAEERLETAVGKGTVATLPAEVDRLALVDESVARVTILGARELLVQGLKVGRTSLFAWLSDGARLQYQIKVSRDLDLLNQALAELPGGVVAEDSPDGRCVLLVGDVPDASTSQEAERRARTILESNDTDKPSVLNLLQYPVTEISPAADRRLAEALKEIDPRITVRRIQVSDQSDAKADSYVLEGRVRTIPDLLRAVTLAERQLGGAGGVVAAPDTERRARRGRNVLSGTAASGELQALQGVDAPKPGLAAQVARGLVVSSDSGRVISFLEVDEIFQVLVSTRVLEIDRGKAQSAGINYRVDGTRFSIASYSGEQQNLFSLARGQAADVTGMSDGNVVGAYVSSSAAILAAVDFLTQQQVARSVAEPNVMTLTGEEATVLVGGEVPIPTTAVGEIAALQSFQFQSFGVRLDIRPTVDENKVITLEVDPSIVRPDSGLGVEGVPGFKVQSVQTTARVRAGQSLVLGGLLSYTESDVQRKVPILGDLPVLKTLFKWSRKAREERELLFVITPRLMSPTEGQGDITDLAVLPELESRDFRLNADVEPQTLTEKGIPSSWGRDPQEAPAPDAAPADSPVSMSPPAAVPAPVVEEPVDAPEEPDFSHADKDMAEEAVAESGPDAETEQRRRGLIPRLFHGLFGGSRDESVAEDNAPAEPSGS